VADIHIYPAKIADAAGQIRAEALAQWTAQLDSYTNARQGTQDAIARGFSPGAHNNWVAGPGRSGQLQESSKAMLQTIFAELDRLVQEKAAFNDSFTAYLDCVAGLAHSVQSADNDASDAFNNIIKPDGGR
jgi:hypothetical protein